MKQDKIHLEVLSMHKHIYDNYLKTGEVINFHPHIQQEIVDAYKVEHPYYVYNHRCYSCIVDMLVTIYRWYEKAH